MPDITVHRHGDRWAVLEAGSESPAQEHPTREAAELAARRLAGGGTVRVDDRDPTGLAEVQDPDAGEPATTAREKVDDVRDPERSRTIQPGL